MANQLDAVQPRIPTQNDNAQTALAEQHLRSLEAARGNMAAEEYSSAITHAVMNFPHHYTYPPKEHLPRARAFIDNSDQIIIRCRSAEELHMAAAFGVVFPRSILYAQKFYRDKGIAYEATQLQC